MPPLPPTSLSITPLSIMPGQLQHDDLHAIWSQPCAPVLDAQSWDAIDQSAAAIDRILQSGKTVYGVNTGFGLLAQSRISAEKLGDLQRNLVLSHCCGTGPALDHHIVRLAMVMKMAALARGYSGVRRPLIERLIDLIKADAMPVIPAQGSVGASGDLAPLAHLAAATMLGVGEISIGGKILPAAKALHKLGLAPIELGPKEGIALLNGTQISTALGLDALFRAERIFDAALIGGALSLDALKGSTAPFDPRIHAVRGHPGQIRVAEILRRLLDGSAIHASHQGCDKVQDPYSLRCQPQVMGACLDVIDQVRGGLLIEANAVTDNPLIFCDPDEQADSCISGGNFHAEPVAFAVDALANALCEIGAISERRLALLVDPKMSGLPAFLVTDSGLHSGFMIAQVTAAALVAENRMMAHPASVDSVPTSANQEDHVSMATHGARRTIEIAKNCATIIGIELLAAAQGVDCHLPLATAPTLAAVHQKIRAKVPHYQIDRYFAPDIEAARQMVCDGEIGLS
ncbi:histidine ammonia-lyase [alpha proteobacterium Q-1]|nr:histidine ammonia-lyase [alpha proteobacterium Q-1]